MYARIMALLMAGAVCVPMLLGVGCGKQDEAAQGASQADSAAPSTGTEAAPDAPTAGDGSAGGTAPSSTSDPASTETGPGDDAEALAVMQQVANEMGGKLPVQINETLRLDGVQPGPGTLMTWYYTNPQAASTALDPQAEYDARAPGLYENFCKPEKSLIRYGVTQHFVFRGNDSVEVTRIVVAPAECEAAFEAMLGRVAATLNGELPKTLDDAYRMDEVRAGPGRSLTYFMTLLGHSAAEFGDAQTAQAHFAPYLLAQMCAVEGSELFFDERVAVAGVMRDKDGVDVTKIDITREACSTAMPPPPE